MPDQGGAAAGKSFPIRLGRFLFRWRGWTAVPPALLLLIFSEPGMPWAAVGLISIVAGEAVRLRALQFIGGSSRTRRVGGDRLVREGPFALQRNPLYFGNFLLTLGFSLLSGNPWFLLVPALLFPVQYVPIILAEEAELRAKFGNCYTEYAAGTPRFLPRLRRSLRADAAAAPPEKLTDAIRVDRSTLRSIVLLSTALAAVSALRGG